VRALPAADRCCAPPLRGDGPLPRGRRARLVASLRALADPTRLEVYRMIATRREPVCVCEITERFAVTQPTVSYHLRILRRARLVEATRRGVWAYYAARPGGLAALRSFVRALPAGGAADGP